VIELVALRQPSCTRNNHSEAGVPGAQGRVCVLINRACSVAAGKWLLWVKKGDKAACPRHVRFEPNTRHSFAERV
jgi:hypothetical protein